MNSLLSVALSQFGIKQLKGKRAHPQIVNYFTELGFPKTTYKIGKVWASAFVNWVAKEAGYEYSSDISARSWLSVGESIHEPLQGDIAVLWDETPTSTTGHVGFFVNQTNRYVYLLSGHQVDGVHIKAYPKTKLLDYRRLRKNQ